MKAYLPFLTTDAFFKNPQKNLWETYIGTVLQAAAVRGNQAQHVGET